MEMKVIIIWFVNHNVTLVRLELEVADAVKVHVHEDVGEHALNEIGPDIAAVVILAAQSFSDVPNEVPQINGGHKYNHQPIFESHCRVSPVHHHHKQRGTWCVVYSP